MLNVSLQQQIKHADHSSSSQSRRHQRDGTLASTNGTCNCSETKNSWKLFKNVNPLAWTMMHNGHNLRQLNIHK